jgi:hypothetical protein
MELIIKRSHNILSEETNVTAWMIYTYLLEIKHQFLLDMLEKK